MSGVDRHQTQLVPADNQMQPAALPTITGVPSNDEKAVKFLRDNPRVLPDLITLMTGYAANPRRTEMPTQLAWAQLRDDYKLASVGISLPNTLRRAVMKQVAAAKPEWAHLMGRYLPETEAAA